MLLQYLLLGLVEYFSCTFKFVILHSVMVKITLIAYLEKIRLKKKPDPISLDIFKNLIKNQPSIFPNGQGPEYLLLIEHNVRDGEFDCSRCWWSR